MNTVIIGCAVTWNFLIIHKKLPLFPSLDQNPVSCLWKHMSSGPWKDRLSKEVNPQSKIQKENQKVQTETDPMSSFAPTVTPTQTVGLALALLLMMGGNAVKIDRKMIHTWLFHSVNQKCVDVFVFLNIRRLWYMTGGKNLQLF